MSSDVYNLWNKLVSRVENFPVNPIILKVLKLLIVVVYSESRTSVVSENICKFVTYSFSALGESLFFLSKLENKIIQIL